MKKKKKSTQDVESPDELLLAATVAARVQIKGISLINAQVSNEFGFVATGEVTLSAKSEYMVDHESQEILVKPSLAACADASEGRPLEILATYLVAYSVESFEGLTDEELDAFAGINGVYTAWPYWREFVQNMTSRLDIPVLTVPAYYPPNGPGFLNMGPTERVLASSHIPTKRIAESGGERKKKTKKRIKKSVRGASPKE